jgi:hypothetical protein
MLLSSAPQRLMVILRNSVDIDKMGTRFILIPSHFTFYAIYFHQISGIMKKIGADKKG